MTDRIDQTFLDRDCSRELTAADVGRASRIFATLGDLASLWMTPAALQVASNRPLPSRLLPPTVRPGAFHVLVVTPRAYPILRPAFALPLRWGRDREHSRRLPTSLLEHADKVLALRQAESPGTATGQWGLGLDLETPRLDLSRLEIDGPSAMAAMFAALDLAVADIGAIGTVLASVAHGGHTWSGVAGVEEKLDAAVAAGATRVFLWDGNRKEGDAWAESRQQRDFVRYLEAGSSLRESLAPFLKELEAPPPPTAPLEAHADYYERAMTGRARGNARREYYLKTLVGPLAGKCGNDPGLRGIRRPVRCLIGCIAPGMPPTVSLVARLLQPEIVRLVHSPLEDEKDGQLAADVDAIVKHIRDEAGVRSVEPLALDIVKLPLHELADEIARQFLTLRIDGNEAEGCVVVDITNGPRRLPLAIFEAAVPGVACVFVDSKPTRSGPHRIGSERIELVGKDGAGAGPSAS